MRLSLTNVRASVPDLRNRPLSTDTSRSASVVLQCSSIKVEPSGSSSEAPLSDRQSQFYSGPSPADPAGGPSCAGTNAVSVGLNHDACEPAFVAEGKGQFDGVTGDNRLVPTRLIVGDTQRMQADLIGLTCVPMYSAYQFGQSTSRWPSRAKARTPLRQIVEQHLGLVERVEALGEPAIDRGEKIAGLLPFTLIAPEPRKSRQPR
jgi:hypothetical protein